MLDSRGTAIRTALIEAEEADGRIGLNIVHLVHPAVEAELEFVRAVNLVERDSKLSGVLAQPVIAIRVGSQVGVPCRKIGVEKNRGHAREPVALQIRRKTQRAQRIVDALRVVGVDVPHSARKA